MMEQMIRDNDTIVIWVRIERMRIKEESNLRVSVIEF